MKNIFIPDNESLMTPDFLKKGEIHYKYFDTEYKTVSWSAKKRLFHKTIKLPPNKKFNTRILTPDEKTEYNKLFYNINKTPKEKVIKECIIVITYRKFRTEMAVGLKVIDGNNVTAFKSGSLNEVKSICKKHKINTIHDNYLSLYLFFNAYLNEIIPEEIWEYTARKYVKIMQRDKIFAERIKSTFGQSD